MVTASPGVSASGVLDTGSAPWSAKYGFGGVWVQLDPPADELIKVDAKTSKVVLRIDGGRNVAIASDGVWVAVGGHELRKIEPMSGKTLLTVNSESSYVAVGAGSVWAPTSTGLQRFDAKSGQLQATIAIKADELTEVAATDNAVWVTAKTEGSVFRVDPAANAVVTKIATGLGAHGVVIADSGVWVTNYQENTVSRIDPATNKEVATVANVGSGLGIVSGGGAIWVGTKFEGVSRIDPLTNRAKPVKQLPGWPYGIAYNDGVLWVTDADGHHLFRILAPAS